MQVKEKNNRIEFEYFIYIGIKHIKLAIRYFLKKTKI